MSNLLGQGLFVLEGGCSVAFQNGLGIEVPKDFD
jgi:hypothetical protein